MNLRIIVAISMCALVAPKKAYQNSVAEVIKIAPLGNSITQAANNHPSYRYPLWKKLIDAKISFDFVGSMNTNYGGNPSRPDYNGKPFDMDHEGHWGWRADEILNGMDGWLTKYSPDMVLMHVGSNDCIQAQDKNSTINEIKQIVAKLRNKNSAVVIFMATLIPCNATGAPARVNDLNTGIKSLVPELTTEKSPVIFVDQNSGIDASKDLYDGIHPGPTGEEKMAQKWFDAINDYITKTSVKNGAAIKNNSLSATPTAHYAEIVCPRERNVPLPVGGSITNLLGKAIPDAKDVTGRSNGVYIMSKPSSK